MHSHDRPFTAEERKHLSAVLKSNTISWTSRTLAAVWGLILVGSLLAVLRAQPVEWTAVLWIVGVGAIALLWLLVRPPGGLDAAALRQDLNENVARVERHEITDVIQMEEYEDLGSAFFLKERDDSVLFLMGQYLGYDVADDAFPSSVIEIVRGPRSRFVIEVRFIGKPIEPSRIIGPFRKDLVVDGKLPEDAHVLDIDWSDIEATYT